MCNTLVDKIRHLAQEQPDQLAVAFKKERLTYKQLYHKMLGIAGLLKDNQVKKGDIVCFSAVSKPEMVAVYLGVQLAGAVAVFLDKNSTPENMLTIYQETDAVLLLTDKPMKEDTSDCHIVSLRSVYYDADVIDHMMAEKRFFPFQPAEDDLAEILFTTGTTGTPKGVMLTYKSVYHIFSNTIEGIHISNNTILLLPLPLNHSFALRVLCALLFQGATVILQNGFTFAREVENNINAYKCNAMACVPASYEVMKLQMQDVFSKVLSQLSYIEFGAGSLSIRQRKEITRLLPNVTIYNTWGSSESGGAIFCNVCDVVSDPAKIGSLGKPLAGKIEVKILDSDGTEIASDASHPGRMALKGDMKMSGYWKNPSVTDATLVDGWLLTGDMAYLDSNGYIYLLGRADDIINVGGEKVSPIEVENIAGQYETIRECACIGVKDPDGVLGQIPVLFIVTNSGYDEKELTKFLSEKLERYKMPQKFMKLQNLPRNRMQKIDRRELQRIWENRDTLNLMNPVVENILSRRSIRKFTDQVIPKDILEIILKCGYHAPSGHNMQSWRFTVLTKDADIFKLKEATKIAAAENKVYFYGFENPNVLILISNDVRNADGCQDASCAAENIMLAAKSYEIGSVWLNPLMTLRNASPVKSVLDDFGIPENHTIWASIALGYPISDGVSLKKNAQAVKFI